MKSITDLIQSREEKTTTLKTVPHFTETENLDQDQLFDSRKTQDVAFQDLNRVKTINSPRSNIRLKVKEISNLPYEHNELNKDEVLPIQKDFQDNSRSKKNDKFDFDLRQSGTRQNYKINVGCQNKQSTSQIEKPSLESVFNITPIHQKVKRVSESITPKELNKNEEEPVIPNSAFIFSTNAPQLITTISSEDSVRDMIQKAKAYEKFLEFINQMTSSTQIEEETTTKTTLDTPKFQPSTTPSSTTETNKVTHFVRTSFQPLTAPQNYKKKENSLLPKMQTRMLLNFERETFSGNSHEREHHFDKAFKAEDIYPNNLYFRKSFNQDTTTTTEKVHHIENEEDISKKKENNAFDPVHTENYKAKGRKSSFVNMTLPTSPPITGHEIFKIPAYVFSLDTTRTDPSTTVISTSEYYPLERVPLERYPFVPIPDFITKGTDKPTDPSLVNKNDPTFLHWMYKYLASIVTDEPKASEGPRITEAPKTTEESRITEPVYQFVTTKTLQFNPRITDLIYQFITTKNLPFKEIIDPSLHSNLKYEYFQHLINKGTHQKPFGDIDSSFTTEPPQTQSERPFVFYPTLYRKPTERPEKSADFYVRTTPKEFTIPENLQHIIHHLISKTSFMPVNEKKKAPESLTETKTASTEKTTKITPYWNGDLSKRKDVTNWDKLGHYAFPDSKFESDVLKNILKGTLESNNNKKEEDLPFATTKPYTNYFHKETPYVPILTRHFSIENPLQKYLFQLPTRSQTSSNINGNLVTRTVKVDITEPTPTFVTRQIIEPISTPAYDMFPSVKPGNYIPLVVIPRSGKDFKMWYENLKKITQSIGTLSDVPYRNVTIKDNFIYFPKVVTREYVTRLEFPFRKSIKKHVSYEQVEPQQFPKFNWSNSSPGVGGNIVNSFMIVTRAPKEFMEIQPEEAVTRVRYMYNIKYGNSSTNIRNRAAPKYATSSTEKNRLIPFEVPLETFVQNYVQNKSDQFSLEELYRKFEHKAATFKGTENDSKETTTVETEPTSLMRKRKYLSNKYVDVEEHIHVQTRKPNLEAHFGMPIPGKSQQYVFYKKISSTAGPKLGSFVTRHYLMTKVPKWTFKGVPVTRSRLLQSDLVAEINLLREEARAKKKWNRLIKYLG